MQVCCGLSPELASRPTLEQGTNRAEGAVPARIAAGVSSSCVRFNVQPLLAADILSNSRHLRIFIDNLTTLKI